MKSSVKRALEKKRLETEKERLIAELEESNKELEVITEAMAEQNAHLICINSVVSSLGKALNLNEVVDVIAEGLINDLEYERAGVFLIDNKGESLEAAKVVGSSTSGSGDILDNGGPVQTVIESRRALRKADFEGDHNSSFLKDWNWFIIPIEVENKTLGVVVVDTPDGFTDSDTLRIYVNQTSLAIGRARFYESLEEAEKIIFSLATAIDEKDPYNRGHIERMAEYSALLANEIGHPKEDQYVIRLGGIMHDIGKIGISDSILMTNLDSLTTEEYELIKDHTLIGEKLVETMRYADQLGPLVRSHHERWDGKGYPDGLAGENIPQGARIIALVDAYDTMTTDRSYRKAMKEEEALASLRKDEGAQFDPNLVEAFQKALESK